MNMEGDQAFLSLLSSQRELLNQLNMAKTLAKETGVGAGKIGKKTSTKPSNSKSSLRPSALTCTNQSISDCGSGTDHMMFSKGLPLSLGPDICVPSSMMFETGKIDGFGSGLGKKSVKKGPSVVKKKKQRRLSSMGFFSSAFFEDELGPVRRDSMLLIYDDENANMNGFDKLPDLVDIAPGKNTNKSTLQVSFEEVTAGYDGTTASEDGEPAMTAKRFLKGMEAFNDSMAQSQFSQQAIHDWDRKMGLKRSHSKTMRQSSRSRKKLRSMMKKEITSLSAKV